MKNLKKLTRDNLREVFGGSLNEGSGPNCSCGCGVKIYADSLDACSKGCDCACKRSTCGKVGDVGLEPADEGLQP